MAIQKRELCDRNIPIAIIGSGCRFPGGANTPSKLWDLLYSPTDVSSPLPSSRFNAAGFYHKDGSYHGHANVKDFRGYFLSEQGVERHFDAGFFGINPAEANVLDPQMRLLLEVTYEALEVSGETMDRLQGSDTGCYVGLMAGEYEQAMLKDPETLGTYHVTGTARSLFSNRLSYFFDWHGPSMTIDTACSSSLVAVHQAVQLLRSGQSRIAIAAGTNMLMDPSLYIGETKLQLLSPDGRSRMWDASANGYARGEGVCSIVMKRLDDALADGDEIECVIRETGVNSDGRTKGITRSILFATHIVELDSTLAALLTGRSSKFFIRNALLVNRMYQLTFFPISFEAHGTGTAAGDPIEAEAIHSAFFGNTGTDRKSDETDLLWVGSIKTICGHTEGTAGLAGILKASLALQKSIVPPNLLFKTLNPRIKRFGFGGTNAHAILENAESYTQANEDPKPKPADVSAPVFTPFIFSAASEKSLRNYIKTFATYLEKNMDYIQPRHLAYTLHTRRSRLQYALSVAARDGAELLSKLQDMVHASEVGTKPISIRANFDRSQTQQRPVVFGIFTGQGAQWAGMGSELLSKSPAATEILERLEGRLSRLPAPDRPSWSLREEIQRVEASRVAEAQFSQPICTAIQIILVELLRSSKLEFSAVVGHSSGEIAAAFAAGLISAEDAICIAYYRGLHSKLAGGSTKGAMMAVGTSFEEASEILDSKKFRKRVTIAAVNSSSSVTLSGDEDAIQELKVIFEDQEKLARVLKVEKAYHSHHMVSCAEAHRESLRALDVKVLRKSASKCLWISSCYGQEVTADILDKLTADYWVDNLINPVLFMQAIQKTCSLLGPCHLAVEIGPHAALRGPALQTIQEAIGQQEPVPYTGLLKRGSDSILSISDGLGHICSHLGRSSLDLQAYDRFVSGDAPARLDKTLPLYSWDHETGYWHDSRYSRAYHFRSRPHELLGSLAPDCVAEELRWRHILSPKEIPWLNGHRLQGQAVFPAAGYVVLAIEASREMLKMLHDSKAADSKAVSLIQVHDLDISQAMAFNGDDAKVEAIFRLHNITHDHDTTTAQFQYSGAPAVNSGSSQSSGDISLRTFATGSVYIAMGSPSPSSLPARGPHPENVLSVKTDDLYDSFQRLGYGYTGPFRALDKLERRLGAVRGYVMSPDDPESRLLIHPAMLDAAIQSVLLAQAAPYDGRLWSLHVPRTIQRITINPSLCKPGMLHGKSLRIDTCQPNQSSGLRGDVDIYPTSEELSHAMIQMEGIECVPFAPATAQDDKQILANVEWGPAFPDAAKASCDLNPTPEETELSQLLDRISFFYLHHLQCSIPQDDPCRREGPISRIFAYAEHIEYLVRRGDRPFWKPDWYNDTQESIAKASEPYSDNIDLKMLRRVGENIIDIAKGKVTASEITRKDQLMMETYTKALGLQEVTSYIGRVTSQIIHKYPHLHVLEVGGGSGSATKSIFGMVDSFSSYTFTDLSSAFLTTARRVFESKSSKINYKILDVGSDPINQGFSLHAYDLIVASMVLHATPSIRQSLQNLRRLLKPGGYLIIQEGFSNDVTRIGAIFGAFPDWWVGVNEGRVLGPFLSLSEWDELLRATGFSGCDTSSPATYPLSHPTAVFVSQAVDDVVNYIRDPLSVWSPPLSKSLSGTEPGGYHDLVLIGGKTSDTHQLLEQLYPILQKHFNSVVQVDSFADLVGHGLEISVKSTILSLSELDKPLFQNLNNTDFEALKKVLQSLGSIFWVPTLTSQFLDLEDAHTLNARFIAKSFLRFKAQADLAGQHDGGQFNMLNIPEREIVLDAHGQMLIPRLKPNSDMNDRSNSSRRAIYKRVDIGKSDRIVRLTRDDVNEEYCLEEEQAYDTESSTMSATTKHTQVTLSHSLASAVSVKKDFGYSHISLGRENGTGDLQLVLSSKLSQIVPPLESRKIMQDIPKDSKASFLRLVVLSLAVIETLRNLTPGNHLIAYEPETIVEALLLEEAKKRHIDVTVMGNKPQCNFIRGRKYVHINPRAPDRSLETLLPKHNLVFLNCEAQKHSANTVARIISLRSNWYKVASLTEYFATQPSVPDNARDEDLQDRLATAVVYAEQYISCTSKSDPKMYIDVRRLSVDRLAELTGKGLDEAERTVVEWDGITEAPVKIRQIDSGNLFSNTRTYWLAGLGGGLGLSLCEWMIGRGAKYIVITSRRPNVTASWVEKMATLGGLVKILPW
ncbi:hypothetical protein IAQ61_003117 [Plenodomus lingam]|uniref:uncharacterized protein n=1 Tax=Leptosphaeria maculans TaxID=5022 RepID=UPI0033223A36|nr:hypothetical protein IAQ61_003117 [Plenodomus lingam]